MFIYYYHYYYIFNFIIIIIVIVVVIVVVVVVGIVSAAAEVVAFIFHFIDFSFFPSMYLIIHPSICLSIYPSISLSIYLLFNNTFSKFLLMGKLPYTTFQNITNIKYHIKVGACTLGNTGCLHKCI